MGKFLLFWMNDPPDPNLEYLQWMAFRDEMASWVLFGVLVTVAVIVTAYAVHASRKKIHRPHHIFSSYTPMYWLCLSVLPGIVVGVAYYLGYEKLFPASPISFISDGLPVALWAVVLSVLVSYVLMLIPGITPAKFRYRPYWLFIRNRGSRA